MRFFRLMAITVLLLTCVVIGSACTGAKGQEGPQGPKGNTGADGIGVENIVNNGDGTFTVNLTNGESYITDNFTGPRGEQGEQGPQGIQGLSGTPGIGVEWVGEWDNAVLYGRYDGVGYQGSSYISKQPNNTNHLPTDTNWWDPWVEKGDMGAKGDTGNQGIQGEPGPGYGVHILSIPACAFRPEMSGASFHIDAWSELSITTTPMWFSAPVYVPDGAAITEISVWYRGLASFYLTKLPFGTQGLQYAAILGSDTVPVADMTKNTLEVSIPFENQDQAWAFSIWVPAGASNTGVSGAQIVYELTPP